MAQAPHRFRFYRVGGLDQVSLAAAEDLEDLGNLDQKLWTALSCPTRGLELDAGTLDLLDGDHDGRVRAPDVLAAVDWCKPRLRSLGELLSGKDDLPLEAIDADTPEGRALLGAARQILGALGRPGAESIRPGDIADVSRALHGTLFNGDGVITPASAEGDAPLAAAIGDVLLCVGGEMDRSGQPGIDRKRAEAFFTDLASYRAWWEAGATPAIQTLGAATPGAYRAVAAVRAKVDDYFARCRLSAVDPRGALLLSGSDAGLSALAARDLSSLPAELAALPIARVEPGHALPFGEGVNPAWASAVSALSADAVVPTLGPRAALSAQDWSALLVRLGPYDAWQAEKKGAAVERLGIERVRELLEGGFKERIEALVERDLALEPQARAIADVVRMVHYHRDLHTLLRNFVSFADFYDPEHSAVFQAGTLYLDARSCELCVRVDDPAAHSALASLSRMYIAYCECRRTGGPGMRIAACFTQGDSDYLMVGRNGVFYDRQGHDWDATIVKIVENPISLHQAFFAPYKKFVRLIEEQVAKFAAAKEQESASRLQAAASGTVGQATGTVATPKAEAVDIGRMVGIIAAIGVGAGALGTLFGGLISGFLGLQPWWAKLVAVAGVLLVISGPSVLVAWLKLRQRTLGPVLDANGWAVNGRVKVNFPLGQALTSRAVLPPGSIRSFKDPYKDRAATRRRFLFWTVVVLLAAALVLARLVHFWPFGPLS